MDLNTKKSFLINIAFASVIALIVYISGRFLLKYLFPFVVAFLIAWLVQCPAKFISSKIKIKTGTAAAIITVVIYIGTVAAFSFILYRFFLTAKGLFNDMPSFLNSVTDLIGKIKLGITSALNKFSPKAADQINLLASDMFDNIRKGFTNFFSNLAAKIAKGTPAFIFSSIVALVAGCYIAKDFKNLLKFSRGLCGEKIYSNIIRIKAILCNSILKIAKGYLILMLITFSELTVGFFIMGIKYAPLLALLISIIDLLPVLGTGTVIIPWAVAEFFLRNNVRGITLLIIYLTVTVVRNFSEPKIIGNQIGINPLFTLIAMFAGLKLIGFSGLIIFPVSLIVIIKYYKEEMDREKADL